MPAGGLLSAPRPRHGRRDLRGRCAEPHRGGARLAPRVTDAVRGCRCRRGCRARRDGSGLTAGSRCDRHLWCHGPGGRGRMDTLDDAQLRRDDVHLLVDPRVVPFRHWYRQHGRRGHGEIRDRRQTRPWVDAVPRSPGSGVGRLSAHTSDPLLARESSYCDRSLVQLPVRLRPRSSHGSASCRALGRELPARACRRGLEGSGPRPAGGEGLCGEYHRRDLRRAPVLDHHDRLAGHAEDAATHDPARGDGRAHPVGRSVEHREGAHRAAAHGAGAGCVCSRHRAGHGVDRRARSGAVGRVRTVLGHVQLAGVHELHLRG